MLILLHGVSIPWPPQEGVVCSQRAVHDAPRVGGGWLESSIDHGSSGFSPNCPMQGQGSSRTNANDPTEACWADMWAHMSMPQLAPSPPIAPALNAAAPRFSVPGLQSAAQRSEPVHAFSADPADQAPGKFPRQSPSYQFLLYIHTSKQAHMRSLSKSGHTRPTST